MTWATFHRESEELAATAETAVRSGDLHEALRLYRRAAESEVRALDALEGSKPRTLGITAISAVALYYKAKAYPEAEHLAYRWLPDTNLPAFATKQLRELLQLVWTDATTGAEPVRFAPGDVLISVKGGEVVYGGAPLDLIVRKVSEVEKMFYRVTEFLMDRPLRVRGEPPRDVKEMARPWLFQAAPGSYQFMVRVQEPPQQSLFESRTPAVSAISKTFLNVVRASATDPSGALVRVVPNPEYRRTFLRMTRNLAPTGRTFDRLDIRDAGETQSHAISLAAPIRSEINAKLSQERDEEPQKDTRREPVRGVLRALDLDQQWIVVTDLQNPDTHTRIQRTPEALDDMIGPMVNQQVIIETRVDEKGRHYFLDIQLDE